MIKKWENALFNVYTDGSIGHKEKNYFMVVEEVLSDEDYIEKARTMPAEEFGYFSQARIISQHLIKDLINIKTSFLESKKKFVVPIIFYSLDYKKPNDESKPCIVSTSNWIPKISIESEIYKWDNNLGKFRDVFDSPIDRILGEKIKYWAYLESFKDDVEYHLYVESEVNNEDIVNENILNKSDPKFLVNTLLDSLKNTFNHFTIKDSISPKILSEIFTSLKQNVWKMEGVIRLIEEWNDIRKYTLKWNHVSESKPKGNEEVIVNCKKLPLESFEYTTVAIYDNEKGVFINPHNNLELLNPQPEYWSYFKKP